MDWNPYKRIAELEAMHAKTIAMFGTMADKLNSLHELKNAHSKWLTSLENRLQASYAAAYRARKRAEKLSAGGTA